MSRHRVADVILFDVGGTLVHEADGSTPLDALEARPIGDVAGGLRSLASEYRLGAVTDTTVMREEDVRAFLEPIGLSQLLEVVVTSADIGVRKPDPAGLLEAARRLRVTPGRCAFVGDRDLDLHAADAAGMFGIPSEGDAAAAVRDWSADEPGAFAHAIRSVSPPDEEAAAAATARHAQLLKPPGSLGELESLGARLAGMAGACPPPVPAPAAVAVFCGDHGVHEESVTPWPQTITAQMAGTFPRGGAAISVLTTDQGVRLVAVDVGVANEIPPTDGLLRHRVRDGTRNLAVENALTLDETRTALDVGAAVAADLVRAGAAILVTGDMGIANTTASAALLALFCGRSAEEVTGRGAALDRGMLDHKIGIVDKAITRVRTRAASAEPALAHLAAVGGLEHAALAGFVVGGAAARVPVVLDGVIATAAAVAAEALGPGVREWCIAGHRSGEPGAGVGLEHLDLRPLLELDLRLGEGTGAVAALPLIRSAAMLLRDMGTLEDLGDGQ